MKQSLFKKAVAKCKYKNITWKNAQRPSKIYIKLRFNIKKFCYSCLHSMTLQFHFSITILCITPMVFPFGFMWGQKLHFTLSHLYLLTVARPLLTGLRPAALLKKTLWRRCFPVNFAKFLGTPFVQNSSRRMLLICETSGPSFFF